MSIRDSIISLSEKLNLPTEEWQLQDWEYIVGDWEDLEKYVSAYKNMELNVEEKSLLMNIILQAFDDTMCDKWYPEEIWNSIEKMLIKDFQIHRDTITYWSVEDNDLEDCFKVTKLVRGIRDSLNCLNNN